MSLCSLSQIDRYCSAVASLRFVTIYLPESLAISPAWGTGVYSATDPELLPGASAITIPFDRFSASLQSSPDAGDPNGDFWQHTVGLNIRRNRKEVGLWLRRLQNRRVNILTQDWYGQRMWFPAMRVTAAREHGAARNGYNGHLFTFARRWQHPGVYLMPAETPGTIGLAPVTGPWTGDGGAWTGDGGAWTGTGGG